MTYKVYSQCNPPADAGEFNNLESLTDQLAYEPLSEIVARFMANGNIPRPSEKADLQLTEDTTLDDVDACFEDSASEDVSRLDKVEALDVLATAQRLVEQLRKEQAQKPHQEPIQPQKALDEKKAYTESQVVQSPQK